jgi:hypothetical protein
VYITVTKYETLLTFEAIKLCRNLNQARECKLKKQLTKCIGSVYDLIVNHVVVFTSALMDLTFTACLVYRYEATRGWKFVVTESEPVLCLRQGS